MFKRLLGITAVLVMGLTAAALGQSVGSPQQEHDVTVRLRNGDSQNGKFITADNRTVELEVAFKRRVSIKTDAVASIIFVADAAESNLDPKPAGSSPDTVSLEAVRAATTAIRALKGLAAAAQVGSNRERYGARLIDVKVAVEETMASLPEIWLSGLDGRTYSISKEIKGALSEYEAAARNWDAYIKWQVAPLLDSVRSNWESAQKHLARAEELLGLLNRK